MSTPEPPVVGLGRTPAIAAEPWRLGSLVVAAIPGADDDDNPFGGHWRQGALIWPESRPGYRIVTGASAAEIDKGLRGGGAAPAGAVPVMPQVLVECPRTNDLDELRARAARLALAQTSTAIARELWTGELTQAAPWATPETGYSLANPRSGNGTATTGPWCNPHLAAADMLTGAADHPAEAVGRVEAAAMARALGGPVYIHLPPAFLLELTQFGIRAEGDRLTTPLGNIIVADPGYAEAIEEDGADLAVYATGPVQLWLDDVRVYSEPDEIVDMNTNAIGVWAERPALTLFDPQTLVGCAVT